MFNKLKEKRRKRLETEIAHYERNITNYEKLLEDIKNNYLPSRDRCEKVIRDKGLNRYKLRFVLAVGYDDEQLTLVVRDLKNDLWDGEEDLVHGDVVFNETFRLRCLNRESYLTSLICNLKDPTSAIRALIERERNCIAECKARLYELK